MRILESQNGVLSNHEVLAHLVDYQARHKARNRRGPGNLATLINEVLDYLRHPPNPLHDRDWRSRYDETVVTRLLERLHAANLNQDLAKGEILMILNLRPANTALLNAVIDDVGERFSEDEQEAILAAIADVLGPGPSSAQANGDAPQADDHAMPSVENGVS